LGYNMHPKEAWEARGEKHGAMEYGLYCKISSDIEKKKDSLWV